MQISLQVDFLLDLKQQNLNKNPKILNIEYVSFSGTEFKT